MPKRIVFIFFLIAFEAVADYFATRRGTGHTKIAFAFLAIFFYIVCNTFWLFALKNGVGLGKGSMIFSVGSAIMAVLLGIYVFRESYTPRQIAGLCLGIVSLVLVNIE